MNRLNNHDYKSLFESVQRMNEDFGTGGGFGGGAKHPVVKPKPTEKTWHVPGHAPWWQFWNNYYWPDWYPFLPHDPNPDYTEPSEDNNFNQPIDTSDYPTQEEIDAEDDYDIYDDDGDGIRSEEEDMNELLDLLWQVLNDEPSI